MTAIFPLPVWVQGTTQPSTPVNDSFLRTEVLARGAISITSTPPGSPADGDTYILGAAPTGVWSAFAEDDVVLWRSGTWYRFAPFSGWLKQVGTEVRRYSGTAWVVVTGGGGGGAVPVQDEGTTVVASPTAINFVGAGVTATNSGGVATVTIPGGGGGGGVSLDDLGFGNIFVAMNVSSIPTTPFGNMSSENATGQAIVEGSTTGSLMQKSRRNEGTGATSASSFAGWRGASHAIINTRLPWKFTNQFGIANNPMQSAHRAFVGVGESTTYSDNDISNLQRIIGIGYDSADTQWQFFTRDLGAVTKTALGASFPKPTVARAALYRLEMEFDGTTVSWTFTNLDTGAVATGSTSANLPNPAANLHYIGRVSAGGVSTTPIFCMCPVFMRTFPL